ncbi:hypothetical protein DERP_008094 [Dermatophagoides pteronyssinus]|uniref:Uncharacterized protein n=1 Tax=Dermatophagoides pteronyssinus TaxID=6956 RepID=A0ABQ8JKH8_DERPT|nr:hypothetical protein DERP_008094 [Dermatophagoides pteronyssinus]
MKELIQNTIRQSMQKSLILFAIKQKEISRCSLMHNVRFAILLHQELIHFNDDNNSNNIYFELMKKLSFFVPYKFGVSFKQVF